MEKYCALILAGGEGKRMMSDKPKALSEVLNKPMLEWILDALRESGIHNLCVVTGSKKEYIDEYLSNLPYVVETAYQAERLGTGHAVMMAKSFLESAGEDVIILGGDAPFIDSKTIKEAYDLHKSADASACVISAEVTDPHGYGRIVRDDSGELLAIVEQKDADEECAKIKEVNSGAYWFNTKALLSVLDEIKSDNAAHEYYLPDALKILLSKGKRVTAYKAESSDIVLGANDPQQLAELNEIAKEKYSK